jgi:hypothetical protein
LRLHSADGRNSVLIYTPLTPHARRDFDSPRLTFRRYGDKSFLLQVWLRPDYGLVMVKCDGERTLVKELKRGKGAAAPPSKVEVAARTRR